MKAKSEVDGAAIHARLEEVARAFEERAALLERLNAEVNKALAAPDLRNRLLTTGNVPTGGGAADFAREIAQESQANANIIRAANIRLD